MSTRSTRRQELFGITNGIMIDFSVFDLSVMENKGILKETNTAFYRSAA
mgnify:CR=1 FL=1